MKQILQNLKSGQTTLTQVPGPNAKPGHLFIKTRKSLISAGTERMLVEFSKGGLLSKAKSRPDKVKQVLDKIRTDGLMPTVENVFKRLDEQIPLGYCNAGSIVSTHRSCDAERHGAMNNGLKEGDRVVSNAPHAEMVCVPNHLCAKIPDNVSDEQAAFTVLGAIGLQGIRLANPTLGERFVVYGAGLIGLMVVQLLRASGCEVLALDLNDQRLGLAEGFGARGCNAGIDDPVSAANAWTDGVGVDGVIIAAGAKTDEIVHQSAQMCRKRGRIVLVGVVGLNLRRADFYEKELTFQVSCSYGPGRYDEAYEQKGRDYPIGYVRWTEHRNFEAVLGAMAAGQLDVLPLISDRFPLHAAEKAYEKISNDPSALGIILEYPNSCYTQQTISYVTKSPEPTSKCVAAMIGAGNFAKMTMGPALAKTDARLKYVSAYTNGAAAAHIAKKYGFENATTDLDQIMADPNVNTVFIATRHNSHGSLICKALKSGKHTFVEKPLCLRTEELKKIIGVYSSPSTHHSAPLFMVGFNRRFSPHVQKIKELIVRRAEPLAMHFSCNAGIIPPKVWVHDPEVGGGRIIGEACHFIDLLSYIAGSPIASVSAVQMGRGVAVKEDKMSIALSFEDGSVGTVNYFGNGAKNYPKETMEIYSEGRILRLDNFRKLTGFGFKGFRRFKTRSMDKGHQAQFRAFVDNIGKGGDPLMLVDEMVNVMLASFAAVTSARESRVIRVNSEYSDCFAHLHTESLCN